MNSREDVFKELNTFEDNLQEYIQRNLSEKSKLIPTIFNLQNNIFDKAYPNCNGKNITFEDIDKFSREKIKSRVGLYYFFVETDNLLEFKRVWSEFSRNSSIPKFNNNEAYKVKDNYYMMYIGKSEGTLSYRLDNHINSGSSSTFCLRLKEFQNKYSGYNFSFGYLTSNLGNENSTCKILKILENFLRENFQPLIGRK